MRGTFANIRLKNLAAEGTTGGFARHLPSGDVASLYDVAMRYADEGTPLIIVGGKEYGTGSSRDWAAKGTRLLGIKAVIVESFERIHRSNLIGMGVLPLQMAKLPISKMVAFCNMCCASSPHNSAACRTCKNPRLSFGRGFCLSVGDCPLPGEVIPGMSGISGPALQRRVWFMGGRSS